MPKVNTTEFIIQNKCKIFYKFTYSDEHYKNGDEQIPILGLNIDITRFNEMGKCVSVGLDFVDFEHIAFAVNQHICWVYEVTLLFDSEIVIEDDRYITNKYLLSNKVSIQEFIHTLKYTDLLRMTLRNGEILKFIRCQTDELCENACSCNGYAIKWVKTQTLEICMTALNSDISTISNFDEKFLKYIPKSVRLEYLAHLQKEDNCQ